MHQIYPQEMTVHHLHLPAKILGSVGISSRQIPDGHLFCDGFFDLVGVKSVNVWLLKGKKSYQNWGNKRCDGIINSDLTIFFGNS